MVNLYKKCYPAIFILMLMIVCACSSKTTPESVAEKIRNNEELLKEDYDVMMDYMADVISTFLENANNDDKANAIMTLEKMEDDDLIGLFEEKVPGFSEAVVTSFFLGAGADIDRTQFYPKGIKAQGAECGSSTESKSKSGELTGDDYAGMVDYMYEAMEEIEVINRTADPSDTDGVFEMIKEVVAEYPMVPDYYEATVKALRDNSQELENSGVDEQKLGRVLDCQARGWLRFW